MPVLFLLVGSLVPDLIKRPLPDTGAQIDARKWLA